MNANKNSQKSAPLRYGMSTTKPNRSTLVQNICFTQNMSSSSGLRKANCRYASTAGAFLLHSLKTNKGGRDEADVVRGGAVVQFGAPGHGRARREPAGGRGIADGPLPGDQAAGHANPA